MIYFITYVVSSFFCEQGFKKKKGAQFWVFISLAVFFPAFLAGIRDVTIGTDRLVYGDDLFFDVMKSQDFLHMESKWNGWIEIGYIYLNFFVGKVFPSLPFFYFVLAAIEEICVIVSLRVLRVKYYVGFAYAAYLFLFFQMSLNALRQSLAIALAFLATALIIRRKYFVSLAFALVAITCHKSSVVAFGCPIIMLILKKTHSKYTIVALAFCLLGFLAAGGYLVETFAPFLNMDASRYSGYFEESDATGFSNSEMCFALMQAFFIFINYKKFRGNSLTLNFFTFAAVASVPLSQILMFGGDFIGRLITFFNWLIIPMYAITIRLSDKKLLVKTGLMSYLVFFWYYHYIYMGWHATYPYKSILFGF